MSQLAYLRAEVEQLKNISVQISEAGPLMQLKLLEIASKNFLIILELITEELEANAEKR